MYKYNIYGRYIFNKLNVLCDCMMGEFFFVGEEFFEKFFYEEWYYCMFLDYMKGIDVK